MAEKLTMNDLPGKIVRFYTVEKSIPIPSKKSSRTQFYDLVKTMEIGDSILAPNERNGIKYNMERASGFKFTQRVVPEGIRIWRIE